MANSAGTIYRLVDFSVAGSLGEPPDDIVFPGNGPPVVLRGRTLQKIHSSTFLETGRAAVPFRGRRAFATGTHVFVFGAPATASATVFQVAKVAVAALTKPVPTEPTIVPDEPISIDDAYLGDDGVVHVLSRSKRALLRWSASSRRFLPPVALRAAPQVATKTAPARRAVFSYSDGVITEVPLRASAAAEGQINTVGNQILGLTDLGSMIMVNASTGSYFTRNLRLVVDPQGGFLAFTAKNDADRRLGVGWEPARRRYYSGPVNTYDASALSYETLLANGVINGASASIENVAAPLRFSADAAFIATGNGRILNADLAPIGVLANDILDAAWLPSDVYSLRLLNGETQVQRWTRSSYVQVGALVLPGTPVRIFRLSDTQLVVVTNLRGLPRFSVVDANLSTDAAATSFAGVYLNRGDAKGDLALYVRRDNTAVLLLRTANPAVTIAETNLTLTARGSFAATGRDATGALHPLAGAIAADGATASAIAAASTAAGAFALPAGSKDSSLLLILQPGNYTAQILGKNNTAGVALVEVYEVKN